MKKRTEWLTWRLVLETSMFSLDALHLFFSSHLIIMNSVSRIPSSHPSLPSGLHFNLSVHTGILLTAVLAIYYSMLSSLVLHYASVLPLALTEINQLIQNNWTRSGLWKAWKLERLNVWTFESLDSPIFQMMNLRLSFFWISNCKFKILPNHSYLD